MYYVLIRQADFHFFFHRNDLQSDKNTNSLKRIYERFVNCWTFLLTSTTMPSCRGPLVFRVSLSPSLEYSHCKPFSMNVFDFASSLFSFSIKFPLTWFFTAVNNKKKNNEVEGKNASHSSKSKITELFYLAETILDVFCSFINKHK